MCFCSLWHASNIFCILQSFWKTFGSQWIESVPACVPVIACKKPKQQQQQQQRQNHVARAAAKRQLRQEALSLSELPSWSRGWITIREAGSRRDRGVIWAWLSCCTWCNFMSDNTISVYLFLSTVGALSMFWFLCCLTEALLHFLALLAALWVDKCFFEGILHRICLLSVKHLKFGSEMFGNACSFCRGQHGRINLVRGLRAKMSFWAPNNQPPPLSSTFFSQYYLPLDLLCGKIQYLGQHYFRQHVRKWWRSFWHIVRHLGNFADSWEN